MSKIRIVPAGLLEQILKNHNCGHLLGGFDLTLDELIAERARVQRHHPHETPDFQEAISIHNLIHHHGLHERKPSMIVRPRSWFGLVKSAWSKVRDVLVLVLLILIVAKLVRCEPPPLANAGWDARIRALSRESIFMQPGMPAVARLQVRSAANVWTDVGFAGGNLNVPISGSVSGTGNFSVIGTQSDNSANSTAKLPTIPARANAAAPSWTEGNQVPLSVDLSGNLRTVGGGGGGGTSSSFAAAFPATGTAAGLKATAAAPTYTEGFMHAFSSDLGGLLRTRCDVGCAAAGDTTGTAVSLNALNVAATVALAGENGVDVIFTAAAAPTFTVVAEVSSDSGTTWFTAVFLDPVSGATSTSLVNPANGQWMIGYVGAESNARVRVSAFTSGSITAQLRSTVTRPFVLDYGSDGTNLRVLRTATDGTVRIDPTGTTTQPVSGTVTANQGTAAAAASKWPIEIVDSGGVNIAAVSAANALKVDGSAVTQPVSGTVTSNQGGAPWTQRIQDGVGATLATVTAGNALKVDGSAVTQPVSIAAAVDVSDRAARLVGQVEGRAASGVAKAGNPNQIGGVFNTTQPTVTTGQAVEAQATARGALIAATGVDVFNVTVNAALPTGANVIGALSANQSVNVAQIAGAATTTLAAGEQKVGVEGLAASGAAKSGNPVQVGGVFNTTQPTVTTGQAVEAQATARGALIVASGVDAIAVNNTPPANQSINVAQVAGTATVTGGTAGLLGVGGNLANNGAAAATNRVATLDGIARTDYAGGTAFTAGNNAAPDIGTDGLLHVAALPAVRPASYHASAAFAGSSTTDNAVLPGNASNTVLVVRVVVSCTQTTAGNLTLTILKRSTADTGGTSAAITAVPDDSNYAAAVSAPLSFTGTGPTVGTAVGNLDNYKLGCMATSTATPNDIYILNLRQKPIVLRGTAQEVAVNFGGAITGGNLTVTFEWMEVTTITP